MRNKTRFSIWPWNFNGVFPGSVFPQGDMVVLWAELLSHTSSISSSTMSSGYCLHRVLHVIPISMCISSRYSSRWLGFSKLRLGVNECVNMCVIYSAFHMEYISLFTTTLDKGMSLLLISDFPRYILEESCWNDLWDYMTLKLNH